MPHIYLYQNISRNPWSVCTSIVHCKIKHGRGQNNIEENKGSQIAQNIKFSRSKIGICKKESDEVDEATVLSPGLQI